MVALNEVCELITDGSHFSPKDIGEGYPMLSVKDMGERDFSFSSCKHISKADYDILVKNGCKPQKGDVLVAKDGSYFKYAFQICEDREIVILSSIAILRPKADVLDAGYLREFLMADSTYSLVSLNYISGTALKRVILQGIKKIQIPLPPLEEQRRIAALLDKVSDLIAKRRAQLDKLDLLVKARFVEMFGDPETNTKHWPVLPMSQVCSVGSSKRIYQSEQSSGGVPFWRVSNLTDLINTGIATADLYIPEERYNELKVQGQVPTAGDILVTSRGTLGQCYIVKENDVFYFQDGMISWLSKYSKSITPLYISYLFAMPGFRKQIESMQAGTTVSYLSIAMIKRLNVMIPSMEIQIEFNDFVRQADKSKLTLQQSLNKLEVLKKALMQQYFG